MSVHRSLAGLFVLAALLAAGPARVPVGPAATATGKPRARGSATPTTLAGVLTGRVQVPAGVLSNNGGSVLTGGNNGTLIANNGSGFVSDNGGGYRLAALAEDRPLADTEVYLADGANHRVRVVK